MKQLQLKSIPFSTFKLAVRLLYFVASWLFLWLTYGDVLFELQEHSCWLLASPKELETLRIDMDLFTYIARGCLTIFAVPCLGALILSLVLSFAEYVTDYIFSPKRALTLLTYIPSVALLIYFCTNDMTLLYGHENSTIFKVVIISIIVLLVIWAVGGFLKSSANKNEGNVSPSYFLWNIAALLAVIVCVYLYSESDKEFRTTIAVKYYTAKCKWSKVASVAEKSGITTKIIAGHRAAALSQLGQIGDRLFKYDYDFPGFTSKGRVDNIRYTNETSAPYMLFYGGLLQPAYHFAIEQYVVYGNYKWALKLATKALVLKRDTVLADKMLGIIDRMPFEGEFVEKYRRYNHQPELMQNDPELAAVLDLKHIHENFEQGLGQPLAVTYFMSVSARNDSQRFQDLALAACLFCKNLNIFANKCSAIRNRNYIPKHFQEAIAFISSQSGNTNILSMYKVTPEINAMVKNFLTEQSMHRNDPDKGKSAMASKYKGTFIYYLFFENEQVGQ